jgi:hypothetical protein
MFRQACPEQGRRAQRERKMCNDFSTRPVHPAPVEACPACASAAGTGEPVEGGRRRFISERNTIPERSVVVTYEAIRKWCRKFGQPYANQLRRHCPRLFRL